MVITAAFLGGYLGGEAGSDFPSRPNGRRQNRLFLLDSMCKLLGWFSLEGGLLRFGFLS